MDVNRRPNQPVSSSETPTQPIQHPVNNQRGNFLIILGVIVLLLVIGGGAYYLGTQNKSTKQSSVNIPSPTISTQQNNVVTSPASSNTSVPVNWKTYNNQQFGITFKYPNGTVQTSASQPQIVLNNDSQQPYFILTIKMADNPKSLTSKQVLEDEVQALRANKNLPVNVAESLADYRQSTIKDYQSGIIGGSSMRWGREGDSVSDSIEVVSINNNKIYTFMIHDGNGAVSEFQKKLIDRMLSTFQFKD